MYFAVTRLDILVRMDQGRKIFWGFRLSFFLILPGGFDWIWKKYCFWRILEDFVLFLKSFDWKDDRSLEYRDVWIMPRAVCITAFQRKRPQHFTCSFSLMSLFIIIVLLLFSNSSFMMNCKTRGGGGTPIYGLYRYVPRNRVWFLRFSVLK